MLKQLDAESYERLNADLSEDNDEDEEISIEDDADANEGDYDGSADDSDALNKYSEGVIAMLEELLEDM